MNRRAGVPGRAGRSATPAVEKDSKLHPANLSVLVTKAISALIVIGLSAYLTKSAGQFSKVCASDGNTCSPQNWNDIVTFAVAPGVLSIISIGISLPGSKARILSGIWSAITLVAYGASVGRIIAIYSTTTFPNPTYAMLQSVIQADLAFSFIGMIAILARCILHLLVQSGRLQLYRPGHAPIQPDVESGNQAQPLSNLSAIHVLPERPLRPSRPPRARLTGSTIGLPRYATEPRDDPPPPYVAVSKEPPESSSMPV